MLGINVKRPRFAVEEPFAGVVKLFEDILDHDVAAVELAMPVLLPALCNNGSEPG